MLIPTRSPILQRARLVVVLALAVVSAGCTVSAPPVALGPAVVPGKADLSTPQAAVKTYIAYTDYAYRLANSDEASKAATPYEGVRVDSYIELNREKDRGIEQLPLSAQSRSVSREGTHTLLAFTELWRYRYFSLSSRTYTSSVLTATYDATYTVVHDKQGWLVDHVDATALTPVQ